MSDSRPITVSMRTDTGRVRGHNEDFVTKLEPTTAQEEARNGWLFVVADGVGGAEAGEVASQYSCERVSYHYLANGTNSDFGQRLVDSMQSTNTDLRQLVAEYHDNRRMATTMVSLAVQGNRGHIANVGDSRGYHWRRGLLKQVTEDQSLVAKLVKEGAITELEAENHPHKNVILYSIGSEKHPQIDLFTIELRENDQVLLCSDGLTRHVSDAEISAIMERQEPEKATQTLIDLANQRGGEDNITVAIMRFNQITAVSEPQKDGTVILSADEIQTKPNSAFLWAFTILLSLTQSMLIFLVWLFFMF